MLTYHKANQLLKPYHYHILVKLDQNFSDDGNGLVLIKTQNVLNDLAAISLDTIHDSVSDLCNLMIYKYIPTKIALLMKHLMESILKNGVNKVFDNHLVDTEPHKPWFFHSDDNNCYLNHDKYLQEIFCLLVERNGKSSLVDGYKSFANTLKNIKKKPYYDFSKYFDWTKIHKAMVLLSKLTNMSKYSYEIHKLRKDEKY